MNTFTLSIASLIVAQVQASQFDAAPVNPAGPPDSPAVESSNVTDGGSFRLTDQEFERPAVPATQEYQGTANRSPARPNPKQASNTPPTVRDPHRRATLAQAEAPVVPVHSTDAEALAAMILDDAINMPADDGTDIALVDLLQRIGDSGARRRAVQIYWRLCLAIAEENFARHEDRYLSAVGRPRSELEDSLLTAEVTQARARQATAALKVLELQEALADVGRLEPGSLPQPVDRPFVGAYRTNFETLFANRSAPTQLKRIVRRLPHQLEVIERRAEAVAASERAGSQLAQAYEKGAAGLSAVLDALAKLSRTRRELLGAVLSYNEQIAEYSFAVVSPGVPPKLLLGTLIRRDVAARPTMFADANVRPASAESPVLEPGEVDGSLPLRPTADRQSSKPSEVPAVIPGSRSILKRVTIDHP